MESSLQNFYQISKFADIPVKSNKAFIAARKKFRDEELDISFLKLERLRMLCKFDEEFFQTYHEVYSKINQLIDLYYELHPDDKIILDIFFRWTLFKDIKSPSGDLKESFEHCDFNDIDCMRHEDMKQRIIGDHQAIVRELKKSPLSPRHCGSRSSKLEDNGLLYNEFCHLTYLPDQSIYESFISEGFLDRLISIQPIAIISCYGRRLSELAPSPYSEVLFSNFQENLVSFTCPLIDDTRVEEIKNLFRLIYYSHDLTDGASSDSSPLTIDTGSGDSFSPISRRHSESFSPSPQTLFSPTFRDDDIECYFQTCSIS